MNILVTGANGQLGRTFMELAPKYEHAFIFTSRTQTDEIESLDVTDVVAVMETMKVKAVDVIINCAGYTDVNKAEDEYARAYELNVLAPKILAQAAGETGAVLIHFSTDYVFDGKAERPYKESDRANPQGVYAKTKLEGEGNVLNSGCKYLIFRISWLYSRYGRNFFKTINAKAESAEEISVVADQTGTPTYARDLAEAVLRIIDEGHLDRTGLYNYSNEGECSWYEFAKEIVKGSGCVVKPCRTGDYPTKVRRPAYSVLDKDKFRDTFGYGIPDWKASLEVCKSEIVEVDSVASHE